MKDLSFFTRRDFMKGAGALGITGVALWSGGCESWWKKIKDRPTRRNIANLAANDPIIQTYKDAVAAMKALPAGDGRNWTKQAQIHNDKCVHGNWWFLPWHRAYLFNFEAICRKLTGNNDFALPYWNWTTSPSIPAPFWGAGNPLLNSTRVATQASVASSSMVGSTTITNILNQTNFILFASDQAATQQQNLGYGVLEGTPHNYIHGFVDGDMGGYMSPLDPIFWCHHNMIECLWVDWNINKGNANTNDPAWSGMTFNDFVDGDGNPAPIQVATTLLFPLLSYQFEPCAPGTVGPLKDKATLERFLREGAPHKLEYIKRYELRQPFTTNLQQAAPSRIKIEAEAFRSVLDTAGREKAVLTIDEVQPPVKQDSFVRVYVNKPDASAATPIDDPHYAGSFAFFCCAEDSAMKGHEGMTPASSPSASPVPAGAAPSTMPKLRYLVDVTPTVRKLSQAGSLSSDLDVTLVTVPVEEKRPVETPRLNVGRIELAVARF
ncbi:MAG: tyrosinase family protein [Pyrinomonadaceae bacterium]|nr:tyrosinase family protein [Pyrinomonadaceae bacterium]